MSSTRPPSAGPSTAAPVAALTTDQLLAQIMQEMKDLKEQSAQRDQLIHEQQAKIKKWEDAEAAEAAASQRSRAPTRQASTRPVSTRPTLHQPQPRVPTIGILNTPLSRAQSAAISLPPLLMRGQTSTPFPIQPPTTNQQLLQTLLPPLRFNIPPAPAVGPPSSLYQPQQAAAPTGIPTWQQNTMQHSHTPPGNPSTDVTMQTWQTSAQNEAARLRHSPIAPFDPLYQFQQQLPCPIGSVLTKFGGKEEQDVENFIMDCEMYFYQNIRSFPTAHHQILEAVKNLEGNAKDWASPIWASMRGGHHWTWDMFVLQLRQTYGDQNLVQAAMQRIENLSQGKGSLQTYIAEFRRSIVKIPDTEWPQGVQIRHRWVVSHGEHKKIVG